MTFNKIILVLLLVVLLSSSIRKKGNSWEFIPLPSHKKNHETKSKEKKNELEDIIRKKYFSWKNEILDSIDNS